jgi:Zn2+/Cd2+-exporting ATPase
MLTKYILKNLDCANCAAKIESHLRKHPAIKQVALNFATLTLTIDTDNIDQVRREIKKVEPEVDVTLSENCDHAKTGKNDDRFDSRRDMVIIGAALLFFIYLLVFEEYLHGLPWKGTEYVVALVAYLLAGWNVLRDAFRTIRKGQLFDENVLMTIATAGAFAIHAVSEAVGVMIFFKVGEFLQNLAVTRSRMSIRALLEIRPDHATVKTASGEISVQPENVIPGQIIIVRAGEKIPLDGIVEDGNSQVNTSALSGEPVPAMVKPGDSVLAGEINISGLLTIKVSKPYSESSISKILELVENATAQKAKTEQFITKFARYYTPIVVLLALCVAVLPPLLVTGQTFTVWMYRALVLLVISCPCALVISIPLGYFGGLGGASRRGILIKGSNFIDALADVKTVVFDKTGTLTKGVFKVAQIARCNGYSEDELLTFAAIAERYSNHPIARSIVEAAVPKSLNITGSILEHEELTGYGVKARTIDHRIIVGNDALMHRELISHTLCDIAGTVVHVAVDGKYAGYIKIGDELKDDAYRTIPMLRREGVRSVVMLTGDNKTAAGKVAELLKLDAYYAGLLPEDKVKIIETIGSQERHAGKIAFVGDGINDAPVLARADVGIAMGAFGSEAAIETADVVLMTDHPSKVAEAIRIGKRTKMIVGQNIVFALTIKVLFVGLGACGIAGMWEAVFADMGTAILAVLNSTRALGMHVKDELEDSAVIVEK